METKEISLSDCRILLPPVSQTFFSKPPGGLYSLPYLSEGLQAEPLALSRAEWWEILFFIKKLEPKQQHEVNGILQHNLDEQVRLLTYFGVCVCLWEDCDDWRRLIITVHSSGGGTG